MPAAAKPSSRAPTSVAAMRLWGFRAAAIGLGILPFLLLELGLRIFGLPVLPPPVDPYLDLHNLRPLFQLNVTSDTLEIGAERMNLFQPASFARDKPEGAFRIFALGGSTTQGEPYSTQTAFPQWLQLNLQAAAEQSRNVEVVNCGGLSYASYRVLAILREVLDYQPDLIVIYTGHNEYLERRTYAGYQKPSLRQHWTGLLGSLHMVQCARGLAGQVAGRSAPPTADTNDQRTIITTEVDALLDYQGGLADYQRGDAWYEPIPAHFRWNLEQMVAACQSADVPLILVRPVSNLLDCPPIKFEDDPRLSAVQQQHFNQYWQAARDPTVSLEESVNELQAALAIDPQHAGAHYLLGQHQVQLGDFEPARQSLQRAKDYDVCPLRAPTKIGAAVSQVASHYALPLVDAEAMFADRSPHGLVGERWLVDHIHPNLDGHQLLGEALAAACYENGLFNEPTGDWENRRRSLYRDHLAGLSEAYFQRGKQRLEGLLLWTQGRAKKVKTALP